MLDAGQVQKYLTIPVEVHSVRWGLYIHQIFEM